jgi:hypothetical protein
LAGGGFFLEELSVVERITALSPLAIRRLKSRFAGTRDHCP